jgi:hypothetical protein
MKSPKFAFFNDRCPAASLPPQLHERLQQKGLIAEDGHQLVSFCGMIALNHQINIFLPRSVSTSFTHKDLEQQTASQLMQMLHRYGRDSATKVHIDDEGDGQTGLQQLSLILSLLEDYQNYGLYARRRSQHVMNSGKPNWPKTVARGTPFPNQHGQPIYLDIYGSRRRYFADSEVSRIHAKIIITLITNYSWLIDGYTNHVDQALKDIPSPQPDTAYQLAVLQLELSQTYSEREIVLLQGLSQFLAQEAGGQQSQFIAGVHKFHYAWEYLLRHVLQYTVSLNHRLPAPMYILLDGRKQSAFDKGMRMDIVVQHPKKHKLIVVDAKYYAATQTSNAPGWSDLVKQFFYAKALQIVFPEHEIFNSFIFPGESGVFRRVEMASRGQEQNLAETFSPIECLYFCPMDVIQHYLLGQKKDLFEIMGLLSKQTTRSKEKL